MKSQIETERKFIIQRPDFDAFSQMQGYTRSAITQIYLESKDGKTRRIRRREYADRVEYTENFKLRIAKASAIEEEREITEEIYLALSDEIERGSAPLEKIRHTVVYDGKIFEIDEYPFWKHSAIMEVELSDVNESLVIPDCIKIIREVTGIKEYSNHSMSKRIPAEDYL
jgi:CYTH domain-containing protein